MSTRRERAKSHGKIALIGAGTGALDIGTRVIDTSLIHTTDALLNLTTVQRGLLIGYGIVKKNPMIEAIGINRFMDTIYNSVKQYGKVGSMPPLQSYSGFGRGFSRGFTRGQPGMVTLRQSGSGQPGTYATVTGRTY